MVDKIIYNLLMIFVNQQTIIINLIFFITSFVSISFYYICLVIIIVMFKNGLRLIISGMAGPQKIRQACNLPTVAINGFGRIGKCVLRLAIQNNVNVSHGSNGL